MIAGMKTWHPKPGTVRTPALLHPRLMHQTALLKETVTHALQDAGDHIRPRMLSILGSHHITSTTHLAGEHHKIRPARAYCRCDDQRRRQAPAWCSTAYAGSGSQSGFHSPSQWCSSLHKELAGAANHLPNADAQKDQDHSCLASRLREKLRSCICMGPIAYTLTGYQHAHTHTDTQSSRTPQDSILELQSPVPSNTLIEGGLGRADRGWIENAPQAQPRPTSHTLVWQLRLRLPSTIGSCKVSMAAVRTSSTCQPVFYP